MDKKNLEERLGSTIPWLRCIQIRHLISPFNIQNIIRAPLIDLEIILKMNTEFRKKMTKLYQIVNNLASTELLPYQKI